MNQLTFFVGKGGVGKTTISVSYAVAAARKQQAPPVTLLSTDPAHSLADILQTKLSSRRVELNLSSGVKLAVWQVNAEKEFRDFLHRHKPDLLSILEQGSIFSAEDLDPLLDTALPGMTEMAALLALDRLLNSNRKTHIVVDTAPFGHTLRLFALPEHFLRFLGFLEIAASRDQVLAEHFGGRTRRPRAVLLDEWHRMANRLQSSLEKARIFLVTTPETFSLNEAVRWRDLLREEISDVRIQDVVLNRAVFRGAACSLCQAQAKAARKAKVFIRKQFPRSQIYLAPDTAAPIMGLSALAAFGDHIFYKRPLKWTPSVPAKREARLRRTSWPALDAPLVLVLGKGGVGKTTVSAALGFHCRQTRRSEVEICSVDPAPSLDDIFQTDIDDQPRSVLGDPKFRAAEMDSIRLFRSWIADLKRSIDAATTGRVAGIHLDLSFERRLLSELLEIVPPGVDEVFATLHILDLLADRSRKVVIDMAPTGHALELLRTPERLLTWSRLVLKTLAAHRTLGFAQDVAVKVAELGKRVRELLAVLRDPRRTQVYLVMHAEPLPDRETERLARELTSLDFAPKAIFVNRLQLRASRCRRCQIRRGWQYATLARLKRQYRDLTLYAVPDFEREIAGKKALQSFTRELWEVL